MKITKRQLQAIKFSSPDETRQALQGLYIRGNEAIATDGHKAVIVTAPKEIENNGAEPLLIDGDQVKQLPKMMPTKRTDLLEWNMVDIDEQTVSSNLHNFSMISQIIDGQFPNIDQVMPDEADRPHCIGVDPRYLRDICDYICKGQPGNYQSQMKIAISDQVNSMLITATDTDGHELKFVLMPSRL